MTSFYNCDKKVWLYDKYLKTQKNVFNTFLYIRLI